jgi:hypothetical protein
MKTWKKLILQGETIYRRVLGRSGSYPLFQGFGQDLVKIKKDTLRVDGRPIPRL